MSYISKIERIIDKFTHTRTGRTTMKLLRENGISPTIRKRMVLLKMAKETKSPTEEMLKSKVFFAENAQRVNNVLSWLSDEESKETYRKVIEFRITHDIKSAPKIYDTKEQYFDKNIIKSKNDVFVDCGAFTGDTVDCFIDFCKNNYKSIISFEPDNFNHKELCNKNIKNMTVFKAGVWNKSTHLSFISNGSNSRIVEGTDNNDNAIEVFAIDEVAECKEATFIKMDIEGSEKKALMGARQTIIRNKPKLAICIYHSDEDMIGIAEYLHSLVPNYKLYVRHYFYEPIETVLYAIYED